MIATSELAEITSLLDMQVILACDLAQQAPGLVELSAFVRVAFGPQDGRTSNSTVWWVIFQSQPRSTDEC
jgi:hypothetical protein